MTQDGLASKPAAVTGLPCDLRQRHPRDPSRPQPFGL